MVWGEILTIIRVRLRNQENVLSLVFSWRLIKLSFEATCKIRLGRKTNSLRYFPDGYPLT